MANKTEKPVAKSLHTITVIVQVARLHMDSGMGQDSRRSMRA
jgi:hypothetical protein